jgi:hypothetical protein
MFLLPGAHSIDIMLPGAQILLAVTKVTGNMKTEFGQK